MTRITSRNWLIMHKIEKEIIEYAKRASGIMLDAGCGNKPYEKVFSGYVDKYLGLDMLNSPLIDKRIDVYSSVLNLPFKDSIFSTILCTEVIQQTPDPFKVVAEFSRVLDEKGIVLLSTTQMWQITNAPYDYFRFTKYGLEEIGKKAGLSVKYYKSLGSFWMRMGLKLNYFINKLKRHKIMNHPVNVLTIASNIFFLSMDRVFFDKKDIINHFVVFEKI